MRNARIVAQDLMGKTLVHQVHHGLLKGKIVEVEAYCDFHTADLACHGSRNQGKPTKRTRLLFGEAGYCYLYLNYGIHWLLSVVTGKKGIASSVLIRAVEPISGHKIMSVNRNHRQQREWTNGPGKLSKAFGFDQSHNGQNLCRPDSVIWIEDQPKIEQSKLCSGARIGLGKIPEPWHSMPWRYWIRDNRYVSK